MSDKNYKTVIKQFVYKALVAKRQTTNSERVFYRKKENFRATLMCAPIMQLVNRVVNKLNHNDLFSNINKKLFVYRIW